MTGLLSLGLAGALDPAVVRELAPRLEAAGFDTLWVNDTPGGDSLELLAVAAEVTSTIRLGSGVIALDRRPAASILADVARLALPEDRLRIGIGSGRMRAGALALVAESVAELRAGSTAEVVVGALGPRMRALADDSDGVLLNWLTPDAARAARGRTAAILYTRTIVEAAAESRLREEAARYATSPAYAANFARLGIEAMDTTLHLGERPDELSDYLAAVDELVLRAITPDDSLEAFLRIVDHPVVTRALGR